MKFNNMKFLDRDVKKMSSLSYAEYYEGVQSHECKECRAPIEHKTDYLLDNNDVSELPQVYLLCNCPKGLWLPLVEDLPPSDNQRDNQGRGATVDDLKYVHYHVSDLNPSEYDVNNNRVYFTKCQKREREEDLFLQSYIKANIALNQSMEDELESLSKDYYKLCCDTIDLNLKLGLLHVFLNHQFGHHLIAMRSGLENSINNLIQYSNPIFWTDYVSTYFDNCIIRIRRLMEKPARHGEHTNSYHTYRERYLKYSPEQKSKWEIGKLNKCIKTIGNQYVAHNDRRFNPEELREPLVLLYDEYTKKVLKSINTLNEMQGLKIVFAYDPGEFCLDKSIVAIPILRIIDNVLKRYVESFSEAAKQLCMEIMQDEKGSVWTISETPERTRLVINGGDYITDQDSQEAQREKWKAFGELEKAGILSVKSVGTTNPSTEYRINRALAKNISVN